MSKLFSCAIRPFFVFTRPYGAKIAVNVSLEYSAHLSISSSLLLFTVELRIILNLNQASFTLESLSSHPHPGHPPMSA